MNDRYVPGQTASALNVLEESGASAMLTYVLNLPPHEEALSAVARSVARVLEESGEESNIILATQLRADADRIVNG